LAILNVKLCHFNILVKNKYYFYATNKQIMLPKRITAVDIFRGMTIAFMILVNTPGTWAHIYAPLDHAKWHGITPTDLIFPFFLFIVGVSIVLAYHKKRFYINYKPFPKILSRSLKIIVIGLLLAGFSYHPPFFKSIAHLRFPGVLQRIGLVFFLTALLFVYVKNWKWYLLLLILILGGYWYSMNQIPINGHAPQLTKTDNLASIVDRAVLGTNHMWKHYEETSESYVQGDYDPEGLLSSLPAIATTILGIFLGLILVNKRIYPYAKLILFISIGLLLWLLGWWWSQYFPLNKRLWTSSYVLYTGGIAYIVFAIIYWITDILNHKKWANMFKYLGMNAIAIFTLSIFITKSFYLLHIPGSKSTIHGWLYHHIFTDNLGDTAFSSVFYALTVVIFYIFVAWMMYRKKIFIKV